jgi:hypothetical protein
MHTGRSRLALAALALVSTGALIIAAPPQGPAPGTRVLLDAHNAYPYERQYLDRIDRALATGLPLAIEQDLIWRVGADGRGESVVGHDEDKVALAPTLEAYFFDRVRPLMEQALREDRRDQWPVLVLNLDFKTNERAHHEAVHALLARHRAWLTTAPRTATPGDPAPVEPGPLLVLTGSNAAQQVAFHDDRPVGDRLLLFGAYEAPPAPGATREARTRALARMAPATLLPARATNYRRWANFPWAVVESGGQHHAGAWTRADRRRLDALVGHAHAQGLWIRFYTLNGHPSPEAEARGWYDGYNLGSLAAAQARWTAAREAGVDFIATDQYEDFTHQRASAAR